MAIYSSKFFKDKGKKGGTQTFKKHGIEHMHHISKLGVKARQNKAKNKEV